MAGIITIELKGVRLFATHGFYNEETLTGNAFEINLSLSYKTGKQPITDIDETINYVDVFEVVQEVILGERHELLEACAMHIAERLTQRYEQIRDIQVNIQKVNAPIAGFSGAVSVTYNRHIK